MAYYSEQQKFRDIGYLGGAVIGVALAFLLCWIFNIEGDKEYGWFAGSCHGSWIVYNWIRSWFFDGVFVKAPIHTSAYNFFWWVFAFLGTLPVCFMTLRCIGIIRKLSN